MIREGLWSAALIAIIPPVKGRSGNAELFQRPSGRPRRLLDQPDDLCLVRCGISHASSPPSPIMLFLSSRFSRVRSATTSFNACASRRRSFTSSEVAARARVAGKPSFTGLKELFRPAIVHRRGDALAATQFGNALLAAEPLQHDANLLLGRKMSTRRPPNVLDCLFRRLFLRPGFLSHLRSLRLR